MTAYFPDVHYDVAEAAGGVVLAYHDPRSDEPLIEVGLPPLYGVRTPAYTRVDGVSLPWGPRLTFFRGAVTLDPSLPGAPTSAPSTPRPRSRRPSRRATGSCCRESRARSTTMSR